jgi:hypothetical protein
MVDEKLAKVSQSILDINSLCANEHKTVLFQIRAAEFKEQLTQRAIDIKKGILKKMTNEVNDNIESIRTSYQDLQAQMVRKPEKEEDLVALNRVIESCEERLTELGDKTDETYKYITVMEKHGERFDENSMINFWLLKVCPVDVRTLRTRARSWPRPGAVLPGQARRGQAHVRNRHFQLQAALRRAEAAERLQGAVGVGQEERGAGVEAGRRAEEAGRLQPPREALFETVPCKYESLDRLVEEFGPYRQAVGHCVLLRLLLARTG